MNRLYIILMALFCLVGCSDRYSGLTPEDLCDNAYKLLESDESIGARRKAVDMCHKAALMNPKYVRAYAMLAEIYMASSMYNDAMGYVREGLKLAPNNLELDYTYCRLLSYLEDYNKLVQYCNDDFLKKYDDHFLKGSMLHMRGTAKAKLDNLEQGIIDLKRAGDEYKAADKESHVLYNDLGSLLFVAKKYDEVEKYLKKSIELDEKYVPAYNNLALFYEETNDNTNAIEYFNKSLKIDPNQAFAKKKLSELIK